MKLLIRFRLKLLKLLMTTDIQRAVWKTRAHISDVRKVEWVIKDGVAYDPNALINATAGTVGVADLNRWLRWPLNAMAGLVIVLFAAWIMRKRTHLRQSRAVMRAAV